MICARMMHRRMPELVFHRCTNTTSSALLPILKTTVSRLFEARRSSPATQPNSKQRTPHPIEGGIEVAISTRTSGRTRRKPCSHTDSFHIEQVRCCTRGPSSSHHPAYSVGCGRACGPPWTVTSALVSFPRRSRGLAMMLQLDDPDGAAVLIRDAP